MRRVSQWTMMCIVIGSNWLLITANPPDAACLPPWFRVHDQCFRTMGYQTSWDGMRSRCGDHDEGGTPGGDLALPKDLKALNNAIEANGHNKHDNGFWLGGHDLHNEGYWVWTNGSRIATSPFPGAGWSRNEDGDPNPDNGPSDNQDCLVTLPHLGVNSLDDRFCSTGADAVCERPSGSAKVTGTCPEGYWRIPGSRDPDCYKLFVDHQRTWEQSHSLCRDDAAHLAIPRDPVTLRYFLVERYDQHWAWLGGRGNDIQESMVYGNGTILPNDSPYWFPGYPNSPAWTTHDYCLLMLVDWGHMGMGRPWNIRQGSPREAHYEGLSRSNGNTHRWKRTPYSSFHCDHLYYALCEKDRIS